MATAISIGTTGLTAASKQMDVIGNNLANSNTLGYKSGSTYFASMLNQSLSSAGSLSVGQGVAVAAVDTQFQQGSFENTGNATDLAIDGTGFFLVKDPEDAVYYTRAGAFHINSAGYLVDGNDYRVQGYNTFATTTWDANDEQADISLKNVQSAPKASTEIGASVNLDENTAYGEKFNVSQSVFDSKGKLHNLSITFMKTEGNGMWGFDIKLDSDNLADTTDLAGCGVVFDKDGALTGMYKGSTANVSQWNAGTVSGTVETSAGAIAGTTINTPENLDQAATGILLTKGAAGWTIANATLYPGATVTQRSGATNEFLDVDLDGVGGADITFDLGLTAGSLWANGDTITFDISDNSTGTVGSTVLNRPGQIYQTATGIVLTKGTSAGVWSVTDGQGYDNMAAREVTVDGEQRLQVDLDGNGGTDLYFVLDGTWAAGNTVQFDVVKTDVTAQDLTMTFGALDNGATIGVVDGTANKITWDVVGTDTNKLTGYASTSVIKSLSDNGYTSGVLKSLTVEGDGVIMGAFTNGQSAELAQLVLADFPNPSGLKKVGNYFAETTESGDAIKNKPGSGGLGEIQGNSLEMSNTDVAKEFINMITAQRAYQASSRIITTADQMLTELMNIKR
ncbi:MAG: flagellar hook-basal body complex protein [Deltaproteobacteria bacterium]|nr:flagellar hook-basal body complex protein [Deltaproteobacteria bacterium]